MLRTEKLLISRLPRDIGQASWTCLSSSCIWGSSMMEGRGFSTMPNFPRPMDSTCDNRRNSAARMIFNNSGHNQNGR